MAGRRRSRSLLGAGAVAHAVAPKRGAGGKKKPAGDAPVTASVAYGTVASENDFPYYAALAKRDGTWAGCGGSLVARRIVVTAGARGGPHAAS